MPQQKTLKCILVAIALSTIACEQKNNNTISQNPIVNIQKNNTDTIVEQSKHETFNETIEIQDSNLLQFLPANYSAINLTYGDLNRDEFKDCILVLKKNGEEVTSKFDENKPEKRPMLLLLSQPDGSFKLAIRNDNAVKCIDCEGVLADPFSGITIKNGYFSIEYVIAGGQHWQQVITFKYDKSLENWVLHKDHFISYKFNESDDENLEALVADVDHLKTSKDFGQVMFDNYDVYKMK